MADHFKKIGRTAGCPASINESAVNGWTDVFTVKASDIADASLTTKGDSVSLQLCKIPTGCAVKGVALNVKKAFTVEDGTLTASVGDSSDAVALVAAQDIKTAGGLRSRKDYGRHGLGGCAENSNRSVEGFAFGNCRRRIESIFAGCFLRLAR